MLLARARIVLRSVDVPARFVLVAPDVAALGRGDAAVGFCGLFLGSNITLLGPQLCRFTGRELAALDPLPNPGSLVGLPLRYDRRFWFGLCCCPFLGEEELRALGDPDFAGIDLLPIRPRRRLAAAWPAAIPAERRPASGCTPP